MNCEVIEEGFIFHSVKKILQKNSKLEGEGRYWCIVVVDGKRYAAECVISVLLQREKTIKEILQEGKKKR